MKLSPLSFAKVALAKQKLINTKQPAKCRWTESEVLNQNIFSFVQNCGDGSPADFSLWQLAHIDF